MRQLQLDLFPNECEGCTYSPWWEKYGLDKCYAYCKKEGRYVWITSECVRQREER